MVEVLVSPIVEACPFKNKDGMMSLLHSFYCWCSLGVILGSTLFFALLALAGDLGGSVGPSMVGFFSGMADGNLKIGLLAATVFPIVMIAGLVVLKRRVK